MQQLEPPMDGGLGDTGVMEPGHGRSNGWRWVADSAMPYGLLRQRARHHGCEVVQIAVRREVLPCPGVIARAPFANCDMATRRVAGRSPRGTLLQHRPERFGHAAPYRAAAGGNGR